MANAVPSRHPRRSDQSFKSRDSDGDRESSQKRGYNKTWMRYAHGLRLERVFCELCMARGIETPIAGQTTETGVRAQSQGIVDHIIPVNGPDDPLFWDEADHWILCLPCERWKSTRFDGSYGLPKLYSHDRTAFGIAQRRRVIVEAARLHFAT